MSRHFSNMMFVISVLLLVSAVFSAPVEKAAQTSAAEVSKRSVAPQDEASHPDEDLQDLLSLVNKQASQQNTMVHKEKVTHFENNNGDLVKVDKEEEKVVDTNSGDVIADVKQEVKQQQASGSQQEPETVVETKIDIPSQDVHETFVQDDADGTAGDVDIRNAEDALPSNEDDSMEAELTPADMAEYLYATQQFEPFYAALDRLVNQSKMTVGEASSYAKAVAVEYERLQLQQLEDRLIFEEGPFGQLSSAADSYPPPEAAPYSVEDSYPPAEYQRPMGGYLRPEEEQMYLWQAEPRSYSPPPMDTADIDPYEFLAALWTEAYGKGNEEARDIVRMLYDRVSQDSNPDDMAQIRDILMETVDASVHDTPFNFDPEIMGLDELPPQQEGYQIPSLPEELLNTQLEDIPTAQKKNVIVEEADQQEDGEGEEEEVAEKNSPAQEVEESEAQASEDNSEEKEGKTEVKEETNVVGEAKEEKEAKTEIQETEKQ
ncbi:uncharacterized protein LOC101860686 [Aplysia californica]|uniref:Uncharacterized protein LOC101860686 n=1 Tax=Aplysia californica TaxID=6500 RepID=A0ABM0K2B5_APLCA|nr:uncharacterized protein LOC101860686 [Aplysia californica]